jgi:hypothetical protein
MDIDVGDLREHYEELTRNATSLFQQFTLSIESQNTYTEGRFRQVVQNCQTFGHDVWTAIGGIRDDAKGKEDAFSNRINRINDDVRLLKVGEDYWKTAVTEWAALQEQRQLRIAEEIGNMREESHCRTHESHKEIAEQLPKEMKVQVEKLKKEQDEIMRGLREAEKKVDEADNENANTVYETEMEMLRNFYMRSGAPSPSPHQRKIPGTWSAIPARGQGRNKLPPPPPPPAGQQGNNDEPQRPKKDSDVDFFRRALRNLGGNIHANRELAIFFANQELELEKARAQKRNRSDRVQTVVKRPTRKAPKEFDGELDSDFTTWKMDVEIHFEYYEQEFTNEKDRISWIGSILKEKAQRWHQARIKSLTSQRLPDNWGAYWQAVETQFKNEHEITESALKLRGLKYKGHISDYLVKLKDLNRKVESAGEVFRDQVKSQMPSEIVDMMYTIGPIPLEDEEFLRVLELAGKRVEEKRRDSKSGDKTPNKEEKHKDNTENKIKNKKRKKRKTIRIMRGVKSKKETRRKNASLNLRILRKP